MSYQPPQPPQNQYYQPAPPPAPRNNLALAAMIIGIVSICAALIPCFGVIFGATGITMGVISQNQIKQTGAPNKGMALAGIICGAVGVGFAAINGLLGAIGKSKGWF